MAAGKGVPGGAYNAGYALISLSLAKHAADETTDAMVSYLYQKQKKDGRWPIRTHRPPLEDSDFTATALSLRAVQLYARKNHKKDLQDRVSRARSWLVKSQKLARTHEDQVFRLFGLSWSHADPKSIQAALDTLLKRQQKNGGWKQLTKSKSTDAYATGQAAVVLLQAGKLKRDHKSILRAITYLRETQLADGSWLVNSRSKPFQKYFESGFPHKKNQWISICGSCWATMALIEARPPRR